MRRTKPLLTMTLLLAFSFVAKAQIQQQGEPLQWMTKTMDRASIPVITTA